MRIREFSLEDYPQVRRLWVRSGLGIRPGDGLKNVKSKVERDPELFLVAEERGEVVGSLLGAFDGRRGWIYHLGVLPEHRKRGVAAKLVREVESRMKREGVLKVNALVYDWNLPSLELFKKLGYRRDDALVHHGKLLFGRKRSQSRVRRRP